MCTPRCAPDPDPLPLATQRPLGSHNYPSTLFRHRHTHLLTHCTDFPQDRYSACPTIRYFDADGYFYLTTLFGGVPNGTVPNETAADSVWPGRPLRLDPAAARHPRSGYGCCFVTVLARSRDLAAWEFATRNPMMGWPDDGDRMIMPGSLLDELGSAEQKRIATCGCNYSDINRSDQVIASAALQPPRDGSAHALGWHGISTAALRVQDMVELPEEFVAQLPGEREPTGPWTYMM